ncbi:hypothetical protein POX_d05946 [Penicillium oxalicum]|uniref:hypothetical protein n=1 Tax=Penicillium oxalicum TaxID=69781 RepID=UPI0020B88882|nr:hypothetical protein POX_d05946 [Penicillium oxalicum]KAI2790433.1 hypothetical protein POX_d05946 [Penicillium oxalicum]
MARVVRRAATAAVRGAPSRAIKRRARKHKVIMEAITQEKKKLRSVICFEAQAPSGFTFIPAGNPALTTACKERCRRDGLQVYAVSTTPHMGTHNLSQHVHRIGYHFPSTVVAAVCSELGLYLTSAGKAVPFHTLGGLQKDTTASSEVDQITINTEARDAIRDLFPNIPDNDLNQIIKTAFQKGQRKVGTASELPLARRAQLAVVAHIRHLYTDYDRLLKQKSFHEARSEVEQRTLDKVIAWRGDDENGQTALEDVFREVIVISDDDDSETEDELLVQDNARDRSVEILSDTGQIHEVQTRPVRATPTTYHHDPAREHSEEFPPGFRIVTRAPAHNAINRRGFSRYQAWNRALNRYRAETNATKPVSVSNTIFGDRQSVGIPGRPIVIHGVPEPPGSFSVDKAPTVQYRKYYHESRPQQAPPLAFTDARPGSDLPGPRERRPREEFEPTMTNPRATGRSVTLTTQKSPRASHLGAKVYPPASSAHAPSNYPPAKSSHGRSELPPPSPINGTDGPALPHRPQESYAEKGTGMKSHMELPESIQSRTVPNREEPVPSIEMADPAAFADKRYADGRLVHLTQGMSLRSVTPVYSQDEPSRHVVATAPDSPDDPKVKRRRVAYQEPHVVLPAGHGGRQSIDANPISAGLRRSHRQEETPVVPPHTQDRLYLRHDRSPPTKHSQTLGYPPQRNTTIVGFQSSSNARPILERPHMIHPHGPYSAGTQPGFPHHDRIMYSTDRTLGPPADATRADGRPIYLHDRSFGSDRVRLARTEGYVPSLRPCADGGHPVVHHASTQGKQYADGFVRSVDIRESRPTPMDSHQAPLRIPQVFHVEADRGPLARARIFEQQIPYDSSRASGPIGSRQPRSPRLVQSAQDQPPRQLHPSPREHYSKPIGAPRDRRPSAGPNPSRHSHDPRAFQMAESNRPIYVQRVEPRPPPRYAVPEGRPIVIVD